MKLLTSGLKWFTAVAVAVAGIGLGGGSLIAPDPAFAKFEVDKLTIGGDIRVRGEFDRGLTFNATAGTTAAGVNHQFIQQKTRIRLNYDVSPDVNFFVELQDSRNWGSDINGGDLNNLGANQNDVHGEALGLRETWIGIKNAGVRGLSLKLGRQKVIFGNHRLLGHFDWNNVGFSLDGVRADYSMQKLSMALGWFRLSETNCIRIETGNCRGANQNASAGAIDSDLFVWYNTFKAVPGMTIEPYVFFLADSRTRDNAAFTGTTLSGRVAPDQKRYFLGTRVNGKAVNKMIDYTAEFVWQTGQQKNATNVKQQINAWAMAVKAGVTAKQAPMKPRIGFEVDYASGSDKRTDTGGRHTFEGLFPTNHLHYGYMDQQAWKNMVDYSVQTKIHPSKASNLKINLHILRLANTNDNWYHAGQGVRGNTRAGNQAASVGKELDIIYTHKFKEGKVGLQIGYGHFFTGEYLARSQEGTQGASNLGNTSMDWGYLQVVTKF